MTELTYINKKICFLLILLTIPLYKGFSQETKNEVFTITLDAGHGGKDSGAIASITDENGNKIYEKNIALDIVLRMGKLLEEKFKKDIKVVYTRKTDEFIELRERANMSNKSKSNLFVSIHCNSAKNKDVDGTEVWILGSDSNRAETNLEVVKRENSVIYLEDDYEKKYEGFNPNSIEDIISLTLMQSQHYDSSSKIAKLIDDKFRAQNRVSRGLKQSGFAVLIRAAVPAVLVELGYISNTSEASYINSENGKTEISKNIFDAICEYKKEWDKKHKNTDIKPEEPKKEEVIEKPLENKYYKIHFLTSTVYYEPNSIQMRGLKNVEIIRNNSNNTYQYFYGKTNFEKDKTKNLDYVKKAGFTEAVVMEYKNNQKISTGYYTIEVLYSNKKYTTNDTIFKPLESIERRKINKNYSYTYGKVYTLEEAQKLLEKAKKAGYENSLLLIDTED